MIEVIDIERSYKVKLSKIAVPENKSVGLRDNEIIGQTNLKIRMGFPFSILAPAKIEGHLRLINTNTVIEIQKCSDITFRIKTDSGVTYQIDILGFPPREFN